MEFIVALLAVVIGVLVCFAGYRLLFVLLPFWGFFAGLWLGFTGIQTIFGEGFLAGVSGLVIGLVLGVIFAVLSYLFYFVGVAILGASVGYGLTVSLLVGGLGMNGGFIVWLLAIAVAVIFAVVILALNVQKLVVIIISALGGASAMFAGIGLLFGQITVEEVSTTVGAYAPVSFQEGPLWWLIWAALAILGIVIQFQSTRQYEMETPPASRI